MSEKETVTLEETPEFQAAVKAAQTGVFDTTLFEMWEHILDELIETTESDISLQTADTILRSFPWLTHADLPMYMGLKIQRLHQIKSAIVAAYPKPQELLFQEADDDWILHKDAYLEILAWWSAFPDKWQAEWRELGWDIPTKGVEHAVIADVSSIIAGPNSLPEHLRDLKDFEITEGDGEKLRERAIEIRAGVSDE